MEQIKIIEVTSLGELKNEIQKHIQNAIIQIEIETKEYRENGYE